MDVWKEHLHLIVPNPADAYKSDYTDHAAWCKAVHELNQNTYTALLSRWRKKHNRRRNLWRDMKAIGLSAEIFQPNPAISLYYYKLRNMMGELLKTAFITDFTLVSTSPLGKFDLTGIQ